MESYSNNQISEFGLILKRWKFILFFGIFFACLAFIVSSLITPKYSSTAKILILQDNLDIDAYRAAKASEYAGEIIEKVVGSSNFMDGVAERYPAIVNTSFWKKDYDKRLEEWNKVVKSNSIVNSGIVDLEVVYENRTVNQEIILAVIKELTENGKVYHGNENIRLNRISGPIVSNKPTFPNLPLVVTIGLISGIFISVGLILVYGEKIDNWFYRKEKFSNTAVPGQIPSSPKVSYQNNNLNNHGYLGNQEFEENNRSDEPAEDFERIKEDEKTGAQANNLIDQADDSVRRARIAYERLLESV
ncbi:MAG: hypothetical protein GF332_01220 [Candidatus Moranbacteria bacterium]|nr:hypothetical protein [Candidatus Moranbacteria bacterium]